MVSHMDFLKTVESRRSIRKYKPDKILESDLKKILECARLAPSAKNLQPYKFIIVDDKGTISRLVVACKNQTFIGQAPLVIVACANPSEAYNTLGGCWNSAYLDTAIAMEHMVLAATGLGLGTCWIGAFSEDDVKKVLDVPDDWKVVALATLGVSDEKPAARPKKPAGELFFSNSWGRRALE